MRTRRTALGETTSSASSKRWIREGRSSDQVDALAITRATRQANDRCHKPTGSRRATCCSEPTAGRSGAPPQGAVGEAAACTLLHSSRARHLSVVARHGDGALGIVCHLADSKRVTVGRIHQPGNVARTWRGGVDCRRRRRSSEVASADTACASGLDCAAHRCVDSGPRRELARRPEVDPTWARAVSAERDRQADPGALRITRARSLEGRRHATIGEADPRRPDRLRHP